MDPCLCRWVERGPPRADRQTDRRTERALIEKGTSLQFIVAAGGPGRGYIQLYCSPVSGGGAGTGGGQQRGGPAVPGAAGRTGVRDPRPQQGAAGAGARARTPEAEG